MKMRQSIKSGLTAAVGAAGALALASNANASNMYFETNKTTYNLGESGWATLKVNRTDKTDNLRGFDVIELYNNDAIAEEGVTRLDNLSITGYSMYDNAGVFNDGVFNTQTVGTVGMGPTYASVGVSSGSPGVIPANANGKGAIWYFTVNPNATPGTQTLNVRFASLTGTSGSESYSLGNVLNEMPELNSLQWNGAQYTVVVPEPNSAIAMGTLGALSVLARRKRK